jgi:hypothetical protein
VTSTGDEIVVEARQSSLFKKIFVGLFVFISCIVIFLVFNSLALGKWNLLGIVFGVWGFMLVATIFVFSVQIIVLDKKAGKMVIARRFRKGTLGWVRSMTPLGMISHYRVDTIEKIYSPVQS